MQHLLFLQLVLALGLLGSASAQSPLFDHLRALSEMRFPVGDPAITITNNSGENVEGPKDVAVADLDADGHADFAAANKDGSVTVYFGVGDATFGSPIHLRTWVTAPLDAGGLVMTNQIIRTCTSVWTNHWLDELGLPQTNWAWSCIPGPPIIETNIVLLADAPTGLRGLALADFTGDALRDIAVASPGESRIYLLRNLGNRNFASATVIPAWLGVRDLAAGDFDGDGRNDLVASGTTNGVAHYRSLGNGLFEVVTNMPALGTSQLDEDFPQPAFYLKAFRPAGAGHDELVIGRAQGGHVRVLSVNAAGRLDVQNSLSNVLVHALDVGPLLNPRQSGENDLVSVNHSDERLEIRAGVSGPGRFGTNVAYDISVPGRAHGVAIADLDNDGWNDLIVVLQRFEKARVLRNNQGVFELASEIPLGSGPRELAVGDFNNDGRADAAILNRGSQDVSILKAHATAFGFTTLDMLYSSDGEVVSLQVYDFNNDGRDDVVQLHRAAGELSVRLARPDGTLSEPVFYGLGTMPSDTRTVDVNNDGVLDVLAVDLGGFVAVRLGRGDGTFGPEIRTSLKEYADGSWGGGQLFSLTTGDFDGDGHPDIAAGYLDCRVGLFKGNGDGTFLHTHTHLLGYETHGLATGDFDQDGDIDLVATPWDSSLIVVENLGNLLTAPGLYRTFITNETQNGGAWTIVVTDYNHDNDLDLLVDGSLGYSLYLGGPDLTFIWTTNIASSSVGSAAISPVTADFNNDGLQDIIAGCVGSSCISVSLGQTGGGFAAAFTLSVPASQLIATGDLDGDGLPDLIGTGEVLWTALSSRAPQPGLPSAAGVIRTIPARPVINEVLAANATVALEADGGRKPDYVELFNGGAAPLPLLDWKLRLERTNNLGVRLTNDFRFPTNAILDGGQHMVLVCSDKLRTPFHTGFELPAGGGSLCLIRADGSEADRVIYPAQDSDHAYARFQDGVNGFVVTDNPSPGLPNPNNGLMPPELTLDGVDLSNLRPGQPIRFFARAKDDVGVVNLSVLWRRLDIPDDVTKRVILYDDGMNGDGALQDGLFSGVLTANLPSGAEIQFYLECLDLSGQTDTKPGNPRFVAQGQAPSIYTLAVGVPTPKLEISEIVANNVTGLQDERGGTPDWIEIRNCSTDAFPLSGISVGQKFFGDGERILFSGGETLAPGQHLVIFTDSKPGQGPLHAPFSLNGSGDQIVLTGQTPSGARYLIDAISYGAQTADIALARLGPGGPWAPTVPTPSAGNVAGAWRSLVQDNNFYLAFPTRSGVSYTVQYKDNLAAPGWISLPAITGQGWEIAIEQPLVPMRFFRVRQD